MSGLVGFVRALSSQHYFFIALIVYVLYPTTEYQSEGVTEMGVDVPTNKISEERTHLDMAFVLSSKFLLFLDVAFYINV